MSDSISPCEGSLVDGFRDDWLSRDERAKEKTGEAGFIWPVIKVVCYSCSRAYLVNTLPFEKLILTQNPAISLRDVELLKRPGLFWTRCPDCRHHNLIRFGLSGWERIPEDLKKIYIICFEGKP